MPVIIDLTLEDDDPPAPPMHVNTSLPSNDGGKVTPAKVSSSRNTIHKYFSPKKAITQTSTAKKRQIVDIPAVITVNDSALVFPKSAPSAPTAKRQPLDSLASISPPTLTVSTPAVTTANDSAPLPSASAATRQPFDSLASISPPTLTTPASSDALKRQRTVSPQISDSLSRLVQPTTSTPTSVPVRSRVISTYAVQQSDPSKKTRPASATSNVARASLSTQQPSGSSAAPKQSITSRQDMQSMHDTWNKVCNHTTAPIAVKQTSAKANVATTVMHQQAYVTHGQRVETPSTSRKGESLTQEAIDTVSSMAPRSANINSQESPSLTNPPSSGRNPTKPLKGSIVPSPPTSTVLNPIKNESGTKRKLPEKTCPLKKTPSRIVVYKDDVSEQDGSLSDADDDDVEIDSEYGSDGDLDNLRAVWKRSAKRPKESEKIQGRNKVSVSRSRRSAKRSKDVSVETQQKDPSLEPVSSLISRRSTKRPKDISVEMQQNALPPEPVTSRRHTKQSKDMSVEMQQNVPPPKAVTSAASSPSITRKKRSLTPPKDAKKSPQCSALETLQPLSSTAETPKTLAAKYAASHKVEIPVCAKAISNRIPASQISMGTRAEGATGFERMKQYIATRRSNSCEQTNTPPLKSTHGVTNDDVEAFTLLGHSLSMRHADSIPNDVTCILESGLNITPKFCNAIMEVLSDEDTTVVTIKNMERVIAAIEHQLQVTNWTPNLDDLLASLLRVSRREAKTADILGIRLCTTVLCSQLDTCCERFKMALSKAHLTLEEFIDRVMKSISTICRRGEFTFEDEQVLFWGGWLISLACNYHRGDSAPAARHSTHWTSIAYTTDEQHMQLAELTSIHLSPKHIRRWLCLVGCSCNLQDYLIAS